MGLLFYATHGAGSGHLARAVTLARLAPVEALVLTEVPAFDLFAAAGIPLIHTPASDYLLTPRQETDRHLEPEILAAVAAVEASGIVFDGNRIPQALWRASRRLGLPLIWIRREMWRAGQGLAQAGDTALADLVILPGELAAEYDRRRHDPEAASLYPAGKVVAVEPITTVDAFGLVPRDDARRALGLAPVDRAVLVLPGAAPFAAPPDLVDRVRAAAPREVRVLAPGRHGEGVETVAAFPLSRLFAAFDAIVSAAGYNSFHEIARADVPALFVPSEHSQLEDQRARAEWAERQGWARCLRAPELERRPGRLTETLAELLEGGCPAPPPAFGSGAPDAIEAIADALRTGARRI